MALMILKSTDAGAPTLNGVNGALCNVLNWALVQNGWAVEYTATNARVYRAGSGNRRRLAVRHDSAISGAANKATVRGCENASSATSYTDPFPTVAQVANNASKWQVSQTADSTARAWKIYLWPTFFYIFIQVDGSLGHSIYFFGDVPPTDAGDVWSTMIWQEADFTIDGSYAPLWQSFQTTIYHAVPSRMYWCRNIDGTVKSIPAFCNASATNSYPGVVPGMAPAREGYGAKLHMEKIAVSCPGAQGAINNAKSVFRRGWLPNLWAPMHNGRGTSVITNQGDTFTNVTYNASATFIIDILYSYDYTNYPWIIFEETDTWSPP